LIVEVRLPLFIIEKEKRNCLIVGMELVFLELVEHFREKLTNVTHSVFPVIKIDILFWKE